MTHLAPRPWVPNACEAHVQRLAAQVAAPSATIAARIDQLIDRNLDIHDRDCFNLNPATNVMNPRAEAALARGLGSRPSLGYPGDKYEMGLEAIEEIEVIAPNWPPRSSTRNTPKSGSARAPWPTSTASWRWPAPATASSRRPAPSAATSPTTPPAAPAFTA
jgi:hypothetical protein